MDNSHDRKKMLYEYRAKNTLKLIYPNEFDHLVKSEKPDWKDETKSIGVEVVRATDNDALSGRRNFLKISGKNISSVSAKDTESVTKYGGNLYIDPATNKIITAEEHSVIGGLGEAVCSALSKKLPTPVKCIGVNDEFGHSGSASALLKAFGLSAEHILEVAKHF